MGVGQSSSGLIAGGPCVGLREIAEHAMDQEWVEQAWIQAGLRLADSSLPAAHERDLVGSLAFSRGEEAEAYMVALFRNFFDACDRTMLPVKKLLWLGLASRYEVSETREPLMEQLQVEPDAAGLELLDTKLFTKLLRWSVKADELLCDAVLSHPALLKVAGEGDREVQVERFELGEPSVKPSVMWALQHGSLKEVLLVTLAVLHLEPAALDEHIACLSELSFMAVPEFARAAQEEQANRIVVEEEEKVASVTAVTGVRPEIAKTALEITGWQLDMAVMTLIDDPARVEAAHEKQVLEQEERLMAQLAQEEERRVAIEESRAVNLAQQLSQQPKYSKLVEEVKEGTRDAQLISMFIHLDRLLVEMECPLRLDEAPVQKLVDGHLLSITFLDSMLAQFSGNEYIEALLLKLLRGNLMRFRPLFSDDSILYRRQEAVMQRLASRLLGMGAHETYLTGVAAFHTSEELQVRLLSRLLAKDAALEPMREKLFAYLMSDDTLHRLSPSIEVLLDHVIETHETSEDVLALLFAMQTRLLFDMADNAMSYAVRMARHCVSHWSPECVLVTRFLGPTLFGMCLFRTSVLLDAGELPELLRTMAAKLEEQCFSLPLYNGIGYFLGKLSCSLIIGPPMNSSTAFPSMFLKGATGLPHSPAIDRASAAAKEVLPKVQDLLRNRHGPEIDKMVLLSAAALLHHQPEMSERDAFVSAIGLKLSAMRKLQLERTEGGMAVVCSQFSERAQLLLEYNSCGSSEGIVAFIESGPDDLREALQEPERLAQTRLRGLQLLSALIDQIKGSVPLQHLLKWVSFSLRTNDNNAGHYLVSLETVDRALHSQLRSAFCRVLEQLTQVVSRAIEDGDNGLCAVALTAWGLRLEQEEVSFVEKCGIIPLLHSILTPDRRQLKSSGTAYQFKVSQLSAGMREDDDGESLVNSMATQVMTILVGQARNSTPQTRHALTAMLYQELRSSLPMMLQAPERPEMGQASQDCQQLVSAAREFNRSSMGITVPDLIRSPDGRANVSFSLWLLLDVAGRGGNQTVCFLGESRSFWGIMVSSDFHLQFHFCAGKKQLALQSTSPLPTQRWVHIAITTRHRTVRMYVSGKLVARMRTEQCVTSPGFFPLHISTFYDCPVGQFRQGLDGSISDARFIPRTVSEEEVGKLHEAGPLLTRADEYPYHLVCLVQTLQSEEKLDEPTAQLLIEILRHGSERVRSIICPMLTAHASLNTSSFPAELKSLVVERLEEALSIRCSEQRVDVGETRLEDSFELLELLCALVGSEWEPEGMPTRVLVSLVASAEYSPPAAVRVVMDHFRSLVSSREEEGEEVDPLTLAERKQDLVSAARALCRCDTSLMDHELLLSVLLIALSPCITQEKSLLGMEEKMQQHRCRLIDMQAMQKVEPAPQPVPVTAEEEADSEDEGEGIPDAPTPPPPAALSKSQIRRNALTKTRRGSNEPPAKETEEAAEEHEEKLARLASAMPLALPNEVSLALVIAGGDYDRASMWLMDRIAKRQVSEVQSHTRGQFPKAWCRIALEHSDNNPEQAAHWLSNHYMELVEQLPDEMMSFKGDETSSNRYFPNAGASERDRRRKAARAIPTSNQLVPQDFSGELAAFSEAALQCASLHCRRLAVKVIAEQPELMNSVLGPKTFLRLIKLLTFRGFRTAEACSALETFMARFVWPVPATRGLLLRDCVFQLMRMPVEEYASFCSADERFLADSTAMWAPNIALTEWVLSRLVADAIPSKEEMQLIAEGFGIALRCAQVGIKSRIFSLANQSPQLLNALPLNRMGDLLCARYEHERRGPHLSPNSEFLSVLFELVARGAHSPYELVEATTLLAPHVLHLEFAARTDSLTLAWFPLQRKKEGRAPVEYIVEIQEEGQQWREVYRGTKRGARVSSLMPGQSYVLRVCSLRGTTQSAWSEPCYAYTMGGPILLRSDGAGRAPHVQVDEQRRTASRVEGPNSWQCVLGEPVFTGGVHYWEVLVDQAEWGTAFIGVAPPQRANLQNTFGLAFANWRGLLGSSEKLYGEHFGAGSKVGVLLDMDRRRVSFFKDNKPMGVAFSNVNHAELQPTLGLKNRGTKMTLNGSSLYSRGGVPGVVHVRDAVRALRDMLAGGKPSISSLKMAYSELKVWCRQTIKRYTTIPGFEVEVNISRSVCAKMGPFQHQDVVVLPQGERCTILGVSGGCLWYEPEGGGPAWNWTEQFVQEWGGAFLLEHEANYKGRSVTCELTFNKFCSLLESEFDDEAIVRAFGDGCSFNVAPHEISEDTAVLARAAFLRVLNRECEQLLPMVDFTSHAGEAVCRNRHLLFMDTKRKFYLQLLQSTLTRTRLGEDEYTIPPSMPKISVNRKKAQRYASDEDESKRVQASLFHQVFDRLRGSGPLLRQHYSGVLDAGQLRTFTVAFLNEGVTDNGGPYRELFAQICAELQSETLPYLVRTPNGRADCGENRDQFLWNSSRTSSSDQLLFEFFGQLVGMAIRCEVPLELSLSNLVWKAIVGEQPSEQDLCGVDEVLYNMLSDMRNASSEKRYAEAFQDVTWSIPSFDGRSTHALRGDGSEPVSFADRQEYVAAAIRYKLEEEGRQQLKAFLAGLASVVPVEPLRVFSAAQLQTLICGEPFIDVDVLRKLATYEGVSPEEQHIKWMWQLLEEMTQPELGAFLTFVWARRRLPPNADSTQMRFKVQGPVNSEERNPDSRLPTASTCFFSISMPRYTSYEVLKSRVLYACQHCLDMDADFRVNRSDIHLSGSL